MKRFLSFCICASTALLPLATQAQTVEVFHKVVEIKPTNLKPADAQFSTRGELHPKTTTALGGARLTWMLDANAKPVSYGSEGIHSWLKAENATDQATNIAFHAALLDASNRLVGVIACGDALDPKGKGDYGYANCRLAPGSVARIAKAEIIAYAWPKGKVDGKFHEGAPLLPASVLTPAKSVSKDGSCASLCGRFKSPDLPRKDASGKSAKGTTLRIDGNGTDVKLGFSSERDASMREELTATCTGKNNSGKPASIQGHAAFRDAKGRLLACLRFGDQDGEPPSKPGEALKCYMGGASSATYDLPPGVLERIASVSVCVHRISPPEPAPRK